MPNMLRVVSLLLLLLTAKLAFATPVWFVIAEVNPSRGDSFLIPMTRAVDIAEARRQIAEGRDSGGGVPSARIAAGSDGTNRDVLRQDQPWSWHVAEFHGFFDVFVTTCTASPQGIEWDPAAFVANSGGNACFFHYTVVAELPGTEHVVGTGSQGAGAGTTEFAISDTLAGAWYDPSTPGQGVFIDVLQPQQKLALGWFAFQPGAAGTQAWWTAVGGYEGRNATLDVFLSSNGAFASPDPVQTVQVGEAVIGFLDCNHASLMYAFADGPSGHMPLERVVHVADCDAP